MTAERRALCIDVGAGTADILLTRPGEPLENAFKLVVPSQTQIVGRRIAAATARGKTIVFRGPVMGGGASTAAMKRHLEARCAFVATAEAALTFADDPERARRLGVRIVADEEAAATLAPAHDGAVEVRSGDLDDVALLEALARLGIEPSFDAVAIAVQDHGFSPGGSNRVFRFAFWERAVAERRPLGALFYDEDALPPELTRMRAALEAARRVAAARARGDAVLVNIGNGHTVCAVARSGRLAGVFEHHTRLLDGPRLDERLRRFLSGRLKNDEVREDGGHGAFLAGPVPDSLPLIATGPRRALLEDSSLPFELAAPHGDMMLTGCFGLLRALEERPERIT